MLSVNINGNLSGLEKSDCILLMNEFDIVVLIEIKCDYVFSVPGFVTVRSSNRQLRGGVALLVKNNLWRAVHDVQHLNDQIWFRLSCVPGFKFGACYIPPSDSLYYRYSSFADIQEQVKGSSDKVVILGDFNARMPNLQMFNCKPRSVSYSDNVDHGGNSHGRELANLLMDVKMCPVNHVKVNGMSFEGNLTYRKKDVWLSQLDWMLCSLNALPYVSEFSVLQSHPFQSDHAALKLRMSIPSRDPEEILDRARLLGVYTTGASKPGLPLKPIRLNADAALAFAAELHDEATAWERWELEVADADVPAGALCAKLTDTLYKACKRTVSREQCITTKSCPTPHNAHQRWKNLLSGKSKEIWNSINWKGEFEAPPNISAKPSDAQFRQHFNQLLNAPASEVLSVPNTNVYMPVLDDPFTEREVKEAMSVLNGGKAAGVDGIPPRALKLLEGEWLVIVTYLFNLVFDAGDYPDQWYISKVFTIFKKGDPGDPNNYRGISIQSALSKLYDSVLNRRFIQWFKPDSEQAGGQSGRSCTEQLVILRLLISYARSSKQPLYLAFIDYVKAYDKIDRNLLIQKLSDHGCGFKYLSALAQSLKYTQNLLGGEKFASSIGVKQGAANSCSLFTFYINSTVRALKTFGSDGYLENLHSLLYMDDTVVLATSRQAMQDKLNLLNESVRAIHMVIHPSKSQYMAINTKDRAPFVLDVVKIAATDRYVYLGSPITKGPLKDEVKSHVEFKKGHIRKFSSFLKKNSEAPFSVKKLVWESAMNSAILYGCESWLCNNIKAVEQPFALSQKQLLSVRTQTCHDLVQLELACPGVKARIKEAQITFFQKLMSRSDYQGSPAQFVINLVRRKGCESGLYIDTLLNIRAGTEKKRSLELLRNKVAHSDSSRRQTYHMFNPLYAYHPVYTSDIPEKDRKSFTQLRLGSHRLKIETGRWSRISRENRLCSCGEIQTEQHVLLSCPATESLRRQYPQLDFSDLLCLMKSEPCHVAAFCSQVLHAMSTA